MCGIFFSARRHLDHVQTGSFDALRRNYAASNAARGPDAQNTAVVVVGDSNTSVQLEFFASELRLRGNAPIVQPHERSGNVLCWNGEIFEGMEIKPHENDGVLLMDALSGVEDDNGVRDVFGRLEGPYAFVYYHAASHRLYFARDPLGRRSLLIHKPDVESPYLLVASTSAGPDEFLNLVELSTEFIFCLDVRMWEQNDNDFESCLGLIPRQQGENAVFLPYAQSCPVNDTTPPMDYEHTTSLESTPVWLQQTVEDFLEQLERSVMFQVSNIPHTSEGLARVAVLFSGGIDCTILAFFAHRYLPLSEPIDLLNVAFHNPRKHGQAAMLGQSQKQGRNVLKQPTQLEAKPMYMVPDRVTGLEEVEELRRLCPGRVWNFVEVDVPYEESQAARPILESLMFPGKTVMDLSLAIALYFASKGVGRIRSHPTAVPEVYTSSARVLLNGLGSDELLGGYGRHRTAFSIGGWPKLIDELQLEIDRIPTRNLGRDDRVISSHGKETRHPFLSLSVVNYVAGLPVHYKMDPESDLGLGDKMLLRLAARKVGLVEASSRKKRAMQFGSHSARMHGEKRGDVEIT